MGFLTWLWQTLAGVHAPVRTEMSLEAHCQTMKPWLVAEARALMRRRNDHGRNHRHVVNLDNLLPDNLTLKSVSIDDEAGNVVIVASNYMERGILFAITVNPGSGGIVVQSAARRPGAAGAGAEEGSAARP